MTAVESHGRVTVGLDSGAPASGLLRQAAREALLRDAMLHIVSVWSYPPMSTEERMLTTVSAVEAEAAERVALAVGELMTEQPYRNLSAEVEVTQGAPAKVLISAAKSADLLVVGRSDGARVRHVVLGSVASSCVRHASGPVMVVPPAEDSDEPTADHATTAEIVVGIDGSEPAQRALRWALAEAELRASSSGAPSVGASSVRAVYCWEEPVLLGGDLMMALPDPALLEQDAEEALSGWLAAAEVPEGVTLTGATQRGNPGHGLLDAIGDAGLVVVGSRGLGGFKGLLLGSVARRVTHLAPCPVVVIP